MIEELTKEKFKNTFGKKQMINLTKNIEEAIDIWPFVCELNAMTIVDDKICQEKLIKYIYRNDTLTFYHALLPTLDKNTLYRYYSRFSFEGCQKGYSRLDLNELYSLDS